MKRNSALLLPLILIGSVALANLGFGQTNSGLRAEGTTPLDTYVHAADTNYTFHLVASVPNERYTAFVLEMTSQAWLTTNEVDRPVWTHWVTIVKPNEATNSTALLFISGGANNGGPPSSVDANLSAIAVATRSVVAEVKMVPNQPLTFAGETEGRK